MSAHRTHYAPTPAPAHRRHTWRSTLAAIATAAVLACATIAVSHGDDAMGPQPSPVQAFEAVGTPLDPLDGQRISEIRVESFRAGYANAVQDGCRPTLGLPVAQARP